MADNPEGESCSTCRFYRKAAAGAGQCRRHPPTVVPTRNAVWPHVHDDDWCGEYEVDRADDQRTWR